MLRLVVSGCCSDLASEDAVADDCVNKHEWEDEEAFAQNMKARLECGAAASSMVTAPGIMYGQNEIASVPNADAKVSATM
jgi:hypothetical protein